MADDNENGESNLNRENWFSRWEESCYQELDEEANNEDRYQNELENHQQQLWITFQNTATAIAQLYRESCSSSNNTVSLWVPFQNAASFGTRLYKDGVTATKLSHEYAVKCAYNRRTKEIIGWLKQHKRPHIRRDELLAYLCGKPPPVRNHHHGRSSHSRTSKSLGAANVSSKLGDDRTPESDLKQFRDALALQSIDGAMSKISMSYDGSKSLSSGSNSSMRAAPGDTVNLHRFVLEEMTRCDARKRSNSASEHKLDSPTRKRSRMDSYRQQGPF